MGVPGRKAGRRSGAYITAVRSAASRCPARALPTARRVSPLTPDHPVMPRRHRGNAQAMGPCDTLSAGSGIPGWWRRSTPSPGRTVRRRVMKPRRPLIASSQKTAEVARGEPQRLAGGVGQVTSVQGLADPVADGAAGVEQADIRNRRRHGSRVGELRICPWASQGAVQGIGRLVGDPAEGYRGGVGWRASSDLLAALAKPSGCERSWRAHNALA